MEETDEHAHTPQGEYVLAGSPRPAPSSTRSGPEATIVLSSPPRVRDLTDETKTDDAEIILEARTDVVLDSTEDLNSPDFVDQVVDMVIESPKGALNGIQEEDDRHKGSDYDDDEDEDAKFATRDEAYRYVYLNDPEANAELGYCTNTVITSRFTIYNFIPKLLFYEFSKVANAYFLIISIMQTIKPISNTGGFPASLPALTIIVLIDMFFACLEDYKRHKADHIANELPCRVYSRESKSFVQSKWQLLQVGDVVKVQNREAVPADLVILAACEPEPEKPAGICYVETKSLDGETNLKLRQGLEATYTTLLRDDLVADLKGVVVCEKPNNAIHRFNGTLAIKDGRKEVISANAVLLRGSTLRNTEYIYGLVVNTGPDTKIMMASSDTPLKWSNMELRLNRQIAYICILMIVLCVTGATISSIWNSRHLSDQPTEQAWYLFDPNATAVVAPAGYFFIQLVYYFLLLNSFIPVSLYVSMTSVKFMQAYFMNMDLEMYHAESDTPFQVRTMSLNEELGQIDYIFSDKTGTLTCNIMEFRKCSINGIAYGHGETEVGIAAKKRRLAEGDDLPGTTRIAEEREGDLDNDEGQQCGGNDRAVIAPFVNYQDDTIFEAMRLNDKQAKMISMFWEHLSVCHTVMPERASDGSVRLSASSPDEQALVAAAACFGFKFASRSPGKAIVERFSCLDHHEPPPASAQDIGEYQVLEVLEFNSTRKRMSVIMRGPLGELRLLCKGADTVMYERLRPTTDPQVLNVRDQTLRHMEMFASEGLRTLVIAAADIDPAFYESWVVRYRTAINDMRQIELRRLGEPNDIDRCMEEIEVNLDILGATAIEDRLQAEVPDTIFRLRQASIKIWMLTGDKEETAINIGFACRLLTPDIERIVISADTHPDLITIMEELERYAHYCGPSDDQTPVVPLPKGRQSIASTAGTDQAVNGGSTVGGSHTEDTEMHRSLTRIESMAVLSNQEGLALVIDGETLELALEECPMLFLSVALKCVAVIACRVSPAQKAELVRLVRDNNPKVRTLAIGDGANDVSMIQSAHVGVGISGQEGMQAANSSDYAIAQFRFLSRMLLVHGRWNYLRMGKLILYIFYKNVMMNLTQFWYMIFTGFSGQKFFLEWGLQGYNLIFTALPIVLISTFEQDVPAYYAHNYPVLYRVGQENSRFNTKIVWAWISSCAWESLVISFGTIYGLQFLNRTGETPNMWVYGCVAFTIVVIVVTLKLSLHQQMWWRIHLAIYVVSFGLWIATAAFISYGDSVSSAYWNGVFTNVFATRGFWVLLPLLVFVAISRDYLWKGYVRAFHPSYRHLAQEVDAFGMRDLADELLAFPPPEKIPQRQDTERGPVERPSVLEKTRSGRASRVSGAKATEAQPFGLRGVGMSRKSVTRGSAFSYDAESVMVESFMATERYHQDGHDARAQFERHASRGSIAFHSFVGGHSVDEGTSLTTVPSGGTNTSTSTSGHSQNQSAGNIFRGARHSMGRRRFFSAANITTTPNATAARDSALGATRESLASPSPANNRMLRRLSRAMSGDSALVASASSPMIMDRHSAGPRQAWAAPPPAPARTTRTSTSSSSSSQPQPFNQ
ncbi:hypothetical protein Poli38472_011897 [Pythium oligandrum]|uniref:Phospholipid-transporting ATPase n=1 Tax=Pythium oligandrum TaxID=41045 RepID=A0A8K1C8B0_PYTOL|nr:hypothetical protein Poli38472_011897 [Pythium oligandrum]|eukprot:TMW58309.1 hypothetical protein Poli38472_011897 [Pythium oligandrum]